MERSQLSLPPAARLYQAINDQANVFRYQLHPMIRMQNVAAHVGRASMLMAVLCAELQKCNAVSPVDIAKAMVGIAMHDLPESISGDIPWPTKREVSQFDDYDDQLSRELFNNHELLQVWSTDKVIASVLVPVVDMAELVMTCTTEVTMGNHSPNMVELLHRGLDLLHGYTQVLPTVVFPTWSYQESILKVIYDRGLMQVRGRHRLPVGVHHV